MKGSKIPGIGAAGVLAFLLAGCAGEGLREARDAQGWFPLFNGRDLQGWQRVGGEPTTWTVEDGLLICSGKGKGWLATVEEFGDFELSLQYRVPPAGNSGVFIRAPLKGHTSKLGMEIQILDDADARYAKIKEAQHTAAIYSVVAPSRLAGRPAGKWNQMLIRCVGPEVTVDLNGHRVIEADMDAEEPLAGRPRRGHIGLQNHGARVAFRFVALRELD